MTGPSRLGILLRRQGDESLRALRGVRPIRGLWVVLALAVSVSAILLVALLPLFAQRVINADDAATGAGFTALAVAMLAQSGLIYLGCVLLGYVTAELFAPRRAAHLRGPRATIWRSLHRLGNATSITLVVGITGTAVGIAIFGETLQDETSQDSPGELGAVQLGVLLFVLLVALSYESIRIVVELLRPLPVLWQWVAGLVYPWAASVAWFSLLPVEHVARGILAQWNQPESVVLDVDGGAVLAPAFVFVGLLWLIHFIASGQPRRLQEALRAARG